MTDDFQIRPVPPSPNALALGLTDWLYVVWDLQRDKRVPFGNYTRHDQAVARVLRERVKRRGMKEPFSCAECGISSHCHGRRWTPSAGMHPWQQPDQALILQRMRMRREERQRG